MADAPGPGTYCRCHWPFYLAHHGRQLARQAERQPAPASWLSVMVRARTLAGSMPAWVAHAGCARRPDGCRPCRGRRPCRPPATTARCAHGAQSALTKTARRRSRCCRHLRLGAGRASRAAGRKQALPRRVVGPLVGQRLADAPGLGLHLQLARNACAPPRCGPRCPAP